MSVIVDTGVFWSPPALEPLRRRSGVRVPAIVFVERARQLQARGDASAADFARQLRKLRWEVAPYTQVEAMRTARLAPLDAARWRRVARAALVAGHVGERDELWTFNPRDFLSLGVPERQVVALTDV